MTWLTWSAIKYSPPSQYYLEKKKMHQVLIKAANKSSWQLWSFKVPIIILMYYESSSMARSVQNFDRKTLHNVLQQLNRPCLPPPALLAIVLVYNVLHTHYNNHYILDNGCPVPDAIVKMPDACDHAFNSLIPTIEST